MMRLNLCIMARWQFSWSTFWTAVLAIVTVGLVATGIWNNILITKTLTLMQQQLEEMRKASVDTARLAEAADQSRDIAQQTLQASQRAWVAPSAEIDPQSLENDQAERISFSLIYMNVG